MVRSKKAMLTDTLTFTERKKKSKENMSLTTYTYM